MMKNNYSIGLTFLRICICFIIIKNMCFYLPLADSLFGLNAIFPYENYIQLMNSYGLDLLIYPFHSPYFSQLYIVSIILLCTMYMMAIGGRLIGIILYISYIILKVRNGFILDGSDNVTQVILPFLILSDNLDYFRYYKKKKNSLSKIANNYSTIFAYALMIQVCFVYLFTALAKHKGELWLNGTAVYYTMRVKDFMATDFNIALTKNHYFVVFSTYFTIFWELSFPFLIWFKKTKFYIILGGVLLHIGIWFFMRIDNFSWVMLSTYFVFITNKEYLNIFKIFKKLKIRVYIDGWCPICIKFSETVKKVDLFNLILFKDMRHTDTLLYNDIKLISLIEMTSFHKNNVYYGFDSIFQICLRTPLTWFFIPLLYILKISKLGEKLYFYLSIKRNIIPISCDKNCDNPSNKKI